MENKPIVDNHPLSAKEAANVAEVSGYLWQKFYGI
jgi:hypothetical protein